MEKEKEEDGFLIEFESFSIKVNYLINFKYIILLNHFLD